MALHDDNPSRTEFDHPLYKDPADYPEACQSFLNLLADLHDAKQGKLIDADVPAQLDKALAEFEAVRLRMYAEDAAENEIGSGVHL